MKANKDGFHLFPLARHVCTTAEHRDADRTRETNERQDHAPRLLTDTCMYIHVTRAPVAPIDQAPGVPVKVGRVAQPSRRRSRHIRPQSVTTQAYQTAESGKWRREVARDIDVPLRHAAIHMDCGWAVAARAALAQTSWECWQVNARCLCLHFDVDLRWCPGPRGGKVVRFDQTFWH